MRDIFVDLLSDPMKEEDYPDHLKDALSRLNEQEEYERKQRELDRSTCRVGKLTCDTQEKFICHLLQVSRGCTYVFMVTSITQLCARNFAF